MKRFHVHAHVRDLETSIDFYSRLFDAAPTRVDSDYAKWMLDGIDPQGIAWGQFHTLQDIPVFGAGASAQSGKTSACCAPSGARANPVAVADPPASSCC
jgi:catechol 2,3-dioxygenase-like lactoylglutathione lyase family enzyme